MNISKLVLIVIGITVSKGIYGQAQSERQLPEIPVLKRVIKINPPSLLLNTINLAYQKTTSTNSATQVRAYFTYIEGGGAVYSGYGISPEYMYYFGDKAPAGMYLSPYLRYEKYKYEEFSCVEYNTTLSGGLVAGYQWLFGKWFTLEMFLGPYYGYAISEVTCPFPINDDLPDSGGIGIRTGMTIGFAF